MILFYFQGKTLNITVIEVSVSNTNAEETIVDQFYEDLEDLLELTLKQSSFHHRELGCENWKSRNTQVTDKFGLEVQTEAGQMLTAFCQENTLVIANTLFQQHKR